MVEEAVHLHLSLSLLTGLAVMAKDSLQSVEASIMCTLDQVNIAETSRRSGEFIKIVMHNYQRWTILWRPNCLVEESYPSSSFWMKKYLLLSIVMTLREQIHKACPIFSGALLRTNRGWRRGTESDHDLITYIHVVFKIYFIPYVFVLFFILYSECQLDTACSHKPLPVFNFSLK